MIEYSKSAFGLNLLFRIHGSAVIRSFLPGILAVGFYLLIHRYFPHQEDLGHPYAIGVVVSGTTFLIVFRASQGYSRYWEATSAIYQMLSKWLDATVVTGVYHLQCHHFDKIKPPSFYDYPELNRRFLTRDRERLRKMMLDEDFDSTDTETSRASCTDRATQGRRQAEGEEI